MPGSGPAPAGPLPDTVSEEFFTGPCQALRSPQYTDMQPTDPNHLPPGRIPFDRLDLEGRIIFGLLWSVALFPFVYLTAHIVAENL